MFSTWARRATAFKEPILNGLAVLNPSSLPVRVVVKLLILGVVVFLVLFPRPGLFVRQVHRLRHLDELIEPNSPALAQWHAQLQAELPGHLSPLQLQKRVEAFVYKHIPYDWDWNTWGVVDYTPTVEELLLKGREDCDGRAVLAASLLRRMGQDAHLVADLKHMWVAVGSHELMSPGRTRSLISTPTGSRFNWRTLWHVPRSLAFGIGVFPLGRELVVLATLVVLLSHPHMGRSPFLVGVVLLLDALLFLRLAVYAEPRANLLVERNWPSWIGLVHLLAGLTCLWWAARRARHRFAAASGLPKN